MLYIAKHTLIVGNNITVKKGQYVQTGVNIAENEVAGLLQCGAIEQAADTGNISVQVPSAHGNEEPKMKNEELEDDPNDPGDPGDPGDPASGFAGKTPEEIDKMFRHLDKPKMIELGAEHKLFDLSMEMTRGEIIAALVEHNVAP